MGGFLPKVPGERDIADPGIFLGVLAQEVQRIVPGTVVYKEGLCFQAVFYSQFPRCFLNFRQEMRQSRFLVIAGNDDGKLAHSVTSLRYYLGAAEKHRS